MFQLSLQSLLLAALLLPAQFQILSVDCLGGRRGGSHGGHPKKGSHSSHRETLHHRSNQFSQWISTFFNNFTNQGQQIATSPSASPGSQLLVNPSQNASSPMQSQPASGSNATSAPPTNGTVPVSQSSTLNTSTPSPASTPSSIPVLSPAGNSTPPVSVIQPSSNTIKPGKGCSTIRLRREWRKFNRQEQTDYINAVKCLATKPSQLIPGGDYRRYDDFENVHSRMRNKIHWIASFLPWHRHFMFLYEQALQKECGYSGNLPRWDWTLDSTDMTQSPVWSSDSQVGFGGNGRDFSGDSDGLGAGVVTDGAFANWQLYYPETHFLQRNYNLPDQYRQPGRSWGSQFFDPSAISTVQAQSTFAKFAVALEGTDPASTGPSNPGPHSIIHVIIGGDISPTAYAANEPLFYLHHSNVDYHWWKWQHSSGSNLNAYGGQATRGSGKNDAKLTDQLKYLGITPDITVAKTMDTSAFPYCYGYE